MKGPFTEIYNALEKSLDDLHKQGDTNIYYRAINLIREKIMEMQVIAREFVTDEKSEVEFFRFVWPWFYGKQLFYIRLYRFEQERGSVPERAFPGLIIREERRVAKFFRSNGEFWMYYSSGSPVLNVQFTRAYSRERIFEPLAMIIDPQEATLGSYRAACCLSMAAYKEWLADERKAMAAPGELSDYSWGPSDTDFVEWLNTLQAVEAIKYKGQPSDISRLAKWAKLVLNKEVANIYDRFNVLRNRKKDRVAFTRQSMEALEKKMDRADGKFE